MGAELAIPEVNVVEKETSSEKSYNVCWGTRTVKQVSWTSDSVNGRFALDLCTRLLNERSRGISERVLRPFVAVVLWGVEVIAIQYLFS